MHQQIPGSGLILIAITLLAGGCKEDQSRTEWWQGEQERIALTHQVELNQYRIDQSNPNGFEEFKRLGKLAQTRALILKSLVQQRQALNEDVVLLERKWVELRESTIRNQRQRAMGKTFKFLQSVSGREFQDVSVTGIDDAGVTIRHADGSARLGFTDLDSKQQVYFGLDADLALAAADKESRASIAYEREIDSQLAILQEQENRKSEIVRREDLTSRRNGARPVASQVAGSKVRPLAQAATPFGNRSWGYSRYYSSYRSYRYPSYRTYYPAYRYVYNYVTPTYYRDCPTIYTSQTARVAGSAGTYSEVAPRRQSFADTTLPYIP